MNRLLIAAAVTLCATPALAANKRGTCQLVVDGKTYINGPCMIDRDEDGGFSINTNEGKKLSPYFVYFNKDAVGGNEASWNADPRSTHAHTSLGDGFKLKAGCWSNNRAKICAK